MPAEPQQKIKPTFTAYTVRNYTNDNTGEESAQWLKIGVAWLHNDGHGYDIQLEAFPVDGRVVLRTIDERIKEFQKQLRQQAEA